MMKNIKITIALFIALFTAGVVPLTANAASCGGTNTQLISCDKTTRE